ncbi:MAG: hypothetical protein ABIB11_03200 [Candidatus Omnitrophota bacterium]
MNKAWYLLSLVLLLLPVSSLKAETEEITLSTYYPAPYGEYEDLEANTFACGRVSVGSLTNIPADDGVMHFEGIVNDPATANSGDMYYNNTSNSIRYYDGTQWLSIGAGGGGGWWNETLSGTTHWGINYNEPGGRVGIGIEFAQTKLHIQGDGSFGDTADGLRVTSADNDSISLFVHRGNSAVLEVSSPTDLPLKLCADRINHPEQFVLAASGNVGIGTIDPTQNLDVDGTILGAMPLIDVALESGAPNYYSAMMVAAVPSTGHIYMRFLNNKNYPYLDDSARWGAWVDFGVPNASSRIVGVSVSLSADRVKDDYYSALIMVRMSCGTVYLRSCENRNYPYLGNPTYWGAWVNLGNPGL